MSLTPEQVQMIWPEGQRIQPSALPQGYTLRTYRPGDEAGFYDLMDSVGWTGWNPEKLQPWLFRILPEGWFFAIHERDGEIIGTCMATHDPTWEVPFSGEVGWTAVYPDHQGKGIGKAVVGAVVKRFLDAGYAQIHLYTEIWRLAALKVYLRIGFEPYLIQQESIQQWEKVCVQLNWPFTADEWRSSPNFD
ncbi:MAG: GNAT family N-acetyltransferase [Anaerolineales bacterium]|nr:GNAT family N-acetyltransferase [Anaerolineales bacterium]